MMLKELVDKQKNLSEYDRKLQELLSSQNRDLFYLNKLCISKVEEISELIVDVIFAFRKELRLLPEKERHSEKSSKVVNPINENIESFYKDVNDVLNPVFEFSQSGNKINKEV